MAFQTLRGTSDLLAEELVRWEAIERTARTVARRYGYQEIRTPTIEDAALFLRSVGETTDIVQKEMFRFADRGGHDIVLRPEGTAPVVRAYLERHLHKTQGFAKLFYLGPMFRAERPQAGRFRQFHQFGVEAIGSPSAWVDVEVIALCVHILRECGVTDAALWLSTMGCRDDQDRAAARLRERLAPERSRLCQDCQQRFDRNVFRVLDCKNPSCQQVAVSLLEATARREGDPTTPIEPCEACRTHFDEVRAGLKAAQIAFDDTKAFARGLDYYTRTVFEVRAQGLGAQDAVAAGGRYDRLVEELGGPPMAAVGFAAGIERLLIALDKTRTASEVAPKRQGLYLAVTQPSLLGEGFRLIQQLRQRRACAMMDYDAKSLKAQLREADKAGCRFVAILGEAEVKQRAITLKDLEQGSQRTVPFDAFIEEVAQQTKLACHRPS
jgi:histidyl-tRNA synthetase